jgi:dipeptidyl aminopeptidase/acylaminoacyl peptidase
VPITGGTTTWECLTRDNPAADGAPKFSPDGKWLAYRAQRRPGAEADRWALMVVETDASGSFQGKPRSVTEQFDPRGSGNSPEITKFDYSVEEFVWQSMVWSKSNVQQSPRLVFTAEDKATTQLFTAAANGRPVIRYIEMIKPEGTFGSVSFSHDGLRFAYTRARMDRPPEVVVGSHAEGDREARNVSQANTKLLAELNLPRPESVTVEGTGGTPMQMWILKPPGFDPQKKWPLVYLVHGGPQSAWTDNWSYRWNPELWAAQGYVIALPNPRGSTGFGQKYVDEISGDWGGKCFEDLMKGVEYLEKQPYIDTDRMAAAGASFGGYMMNWFAGHPTKFKTLINHCGVFNHESMYATTEELWFDEWDHGEGKPLWENREKYRKHSPHLLAKNFKTPMLIIHNDLDFRVPVGEGHQLFTTLQRLGVPSKFINFPDEGHWVLKPANSKYWHEEVFAWLKKYASPGGR